MQADEASDNKPELDNVASEDLNEVEKTPPQATETSPEFFNINQAGQFIARKYSRSFRNLVFKAPTQIVDGAPVEFVDGDLKVVVATARLRFRNLATLNTSGDMVVNVSLSDLTYENAAVAMKVEY